MASFASNIGAPLSTVSSFMNSKKVPKAETLLKIASFYDVSLDWIVSGEQASTSNVSVPIEATTTIRRFDIEASAGAGALALAEVATIELAVERTFLERYGVDPSTCFVMGIKGNSMYPTLADGDDAAVTTQMEPQQLAANHIWVFEDAVGLRVKRITRLSNGDYLITSDNRESRDEQVKAADFERDIRIIGRVFWSGGAIRPG